MPHSETALSNPGLLGRMLDWVRAHADPGTNLAGMSHDDLHNLAHDLSLTDVDLLAVGAGRDNTALMEGMMRARGLDPDQLRHGFVMLMRDLERVCTRCRVTGRCRRELDAGTAAANCHAYCPNAGTLDDLMEGASPPG